MALKIHRPVLGTGFTGSEDRYILHWMQEFAKALLEKYPDAIDEIYYDEIDRDSGNRPDLSNRLLSKPCINGDCNDYGLIPIQDTGCVVENTETGDYIVFTVDERHHSITSHYLCDKHCRAIYRSHYAPAQIKWIDEVQGWRHNGVSVDGNHRVRPWMFPQFRCSAVENGNIPQTDEFWENLYQQRQTSEKDIPFAFAGSGTESFRLTMLSLQEICPDFSIIGRLNYEHFIPHLSRFKIGASLWADWDRMSLDLENRDCRQNGEWCYRDVEYLAAGIPFIRQEYEDSVWGGSYLPNVHYISIPLADIKRAFRAGSCNGVAKLYKQKYEEVKDNQELLDAISRNQHDLWKTWFSAKASIQKSIEVVEQNLILA